MCKAIYLAVIVIIALLLAGGTVLATDGEETGEEGFISPKATWNGDNKVTLSKGGAFLLIPDSTADTVGVYNPYDGTYMGDLITGFASFSTPICAMLGPDGNLYVSDQVADSVFVFDMDGNYLSTYADSSDGLNNIRGIDFFNGHLFVTSGDDYVAEFDGPHNRLPDFINDGSDPFDILFLEDGKALLTDIQGTTDNVRLYNADGTLDHEIFKVSFPEQVQMDALLPGAWLNASFSDDVITDFELDGTIHETTYHDSGRGVFRLGNGNLLATNSGGVWEIEPVTGNVIEQENTGSCRFIELVYVESFFADSDTISARWGSTVNLTLDAGPDHANEDYIIFAGASGTWPGTWLPGGNALLPLNLDYFTYYVYSLMNTSAFQNFAGTLDQYGKAVAKIVTKGLGPSSPGCIGKTIRWAYGLLKKWGFASNAVSTEIVP